MGYFNITDKMLTYREILIPVGLMFSYSHIEYVVARLRQHTETFGIQLNPMTQNLDFKSLLGENEPVKPPSTLYIRTCLA